MRTIIFALALALPAVAQIQSSNRSPVTCTGSPATCSLPSGATLAVSTAVLGTDIATPANPAAGTTKLYAKGGAWCSLSPAGVESCTGAGGIAGAANLTTVNAVPFVNVAGTLSQDANLNWQPASATRPIGAFSVGTGHASNGWVLGGRGTDSGASYAVPYFTPYTAGKAIAFDLFPSGYPADTGLGTAYQDICNSPLDPANTSEWSCASWGHGGKVFSTANGTLVSAVLDGVTATVNTSIPHGLSVGATPFFCISSSNNLPFPTAPGAAYATISAVTATSFSWTTARTAGTYTTGQTCYFPGNVHMGFHSSSNIAATGTNTYIGVGTAYYLQSRVGTTATIYAAGADGVAYWLSGGVQKLRWASSQYKFASDQSIGFNSGTDAASGSADTGMARNAAAVTEFNSGTAGRFADVKLRHILGGSVATYAPAPTITAAFGTTPAIAGTDTAMRVTVGTGGDTTGTVTFGTAWATAPVCVCNNSTSAQACRAAPTTTTVVLTGTFTAADAIGVLCMGY